MTTAKYHKSATKDIRPFFGAAALEQALHGAQIRLFDDQPFTDAISFTIEEHDSPRLNITVRPNLSEATLAGGSIPRSKLMLAITALNPFIKKTVLVQKFVLTGEPPPEVPIGSEVLELLGGGGTNMTVEV